MWEIFSYGDKPFGSMNNVLIPVQIEEKKMPEQPDGCSADVYALLHRCWDHDPKMRPSFGLIRRQMETHMKAEREQGGGVEPRCVGELSQGQAESAVRGAPRSRRAHSCASVGRGSDAVCCHGGPSGCTCSAHVHDTHAL